jgi:hypothetical protein
MSGEVAHLLDEWLGDRNDRAAFVDCSPWL